MIRAAATDVPRPVGGLVRYDAACRALADAKSVDEVKDLRDKAEAMRAYAHQAKNKQLEVDAAEIRIRAERRLGEMISEQKATVGLNSGALRRGAVEEPRDDRPTLAEAGIDKKLSARAQKIAAVPAEQFEEMIGEWRGRVEAENERITVNLLKAGEKRMAETAPVELVADEDREFDALISAWDAAGDEARARFSAHIGIQAKPERTTTTARHQVSPSSPAPNLEMKTTGAASRPSPSAPVATPKPLRPYCRRPELCGGYGRNHCGPCEKAKRESEAA